jgi:hypothetical protein
MKRALFFAFLIASSNAYAQQPPRPDQAPRFDKAPKADAPRAIERPRTPQLSNAELAGLLQAQTTAIKSLSSQVDSLEERILKIEKGAR